MNALDVFRSRRVLILLLLGYGSGLPYLLTGATLSAWMTNAGVSVKAVALFSLVALPYSLKFLWAPLVDRYQVPLLGRRRGWMVVTQLALMAAIAALGTIDPRPSAPGAGASRPVLAIAALAVLVAFLSATQDIVIDAYRADLLHREERAPGIAVFVLGYRFGMITAGAVALILSDHIAWRSVYRLMALLMAVGVIATLRAPEPERVQPPRDLRAAVVEPFVEFFRRRGAVPVLLLIMLFGLGDHIARTLVTPFLIHTGFSNSEIGEVTKVFGVIAILLGTLVGGGIVARIGLWRSMVLFGALQPLGAICYALLAAAGKRHSLLLLAVGVDNVFTGLSIAALEAFLIALVDKRFSATQYALLMSATSLAGRVIGASGGVFAERHGWVAFFLGSALVAVPSIALLVALRGVVEGVDRGARAAEPAAAGAPAA